MTNIDTEVTEKVLRYLGYLNRELMDRCKEGLVIVGDFLIEVYSFGKYYSDTIELVVDEKCINNLENIIKQIGIKTFQGYKFVDIDISRTIKLHSCSLQEYDLIPIEIDNAIINALTPEDLILYYLNKYKESNNKEYFLKSYDTFIILNDWIDKDILINKALRHKLLNEIMFLMKLVKLSYFN